MSPTQERVKHMVKLSFYETKKFRTAKGTIMEKTLKELITMSILFENFTDMLIRMQEATKILDELDAQMESTQHRKRPNLRKYRHRK